MILSEQLLMFYLGLSLADIPSAAHDRRPVFDLMTLKESIATKRKLPHSTIYPPTVVVVTCGWHLLSMSKGLEVGYVVSHVGVHGVGHGISHGIGHGVGHGDSHEVGVFMS